MDTLDGTVRPAGGRNKGSLEVDILARSAALARARRGKSADSVLFR
jgi:hypothetical protein